MGTLEEKRAQLARELAALDQKISKQRNDSYRALGQLVAQASLENTEIAKTLIAIYERYEDMTAGQYDVMQPVMSEVSEKAGIALSRKRPEGGRGRPRSER